MPQWVTKRKRIIPENKTRHTLIIENLGDSVIFIPVPPGYYLEKGMTLTLGSMGFVYTGKIKLKGRKLHYRVRDNSDPI